MKLIPILPKLYHHQTINQAEKEREEDIHHNANTSRRCVLRLPHLHMRSSRMPIGERNSTIQCRHIVPCRLCSKTIANSPTSRRSGAKANCTVQCGYKLSQ